MLGRRSLSLPLISCYPDIERILRQLRSERNSNLLGKRTTETMGDDNPIALRDHYLPTTYTSPTCLRLPDVTAAHYEIKPSTIQSLPSFLGLSTENPYDFLGEFLAICSTIKLSVFTEDALRMRLFPFSLKERAKHWFHSLAPNSITSWAQLQQEFLKKYFPIGKTNDIRRAITSISQNEGEQLYETWEILKDLLRSCPHHAVPKWQLVQSFYEGLTEPNRQMVDASCGGTFMMKSEDEAWTLFENLSNNSIQHASTRRRVPAPKAPKIEGLFEIGHSSDVATQVVDAITRKLDQMMVAGFAPNSTHIHTQHTPCSFCSNPMHHTNDCPTAGKFYDDSTEQVNAVFSHPGNDPYSNTYNQGGEIIPISHGRLKLQVTQSQGCIIKLNLTGSPTNLLPHTALHNSNLRPHHLLS